MKPKIQTILISLIAATGLFSLSGCGGKITDAEISQVIATRSNDIKNQNNGLNALPQTKMILLAGEGFPIDLENDTLVLDSWSVTVIQRGNPVSNLGVPKVSVHSSVSSASASITPNDIPIGTKLYPVIYQLSSKDKKYEGVPQERYFYKDTYGKWASVEPDDVGLEYSAASVRIVTEFQQQMKEKQKAMAESPRGVVSAWLEQLKKSKPGYYDYDALGALEYVSQDYKGGFLKNSLGGITQPLTLDYDQGAEVRQSRANKLMETVRDIKIIDQKIDNKSASVTLSADRAVGLKKVDGKWLITEAPQFFKEGMFSKDEGMPSLVVASFIRGLQEISSGKTDSDLRNPSSQKSTKPARAVKNVRPAAGVPLAARDNLGEQEKIINDALLEYVTPEYKDAITKEFFGELKSESQQNPDDPITQEQVKTLKKLGFDNVDQFTQGEYADFLASAMKEGLDVPDSSKPPIRKYLDSIIDAEHGISNAVISEEITSDSAKVGLNGAGKMNGKGKTVSLQKIDGKWMITGIQ